MIKVFLAGGARITGSIRFQREAGSTREKDPLELNPGPNVYGCLGFGLEFGSGWGSRDAASLRLVRSGRYWLGAKEGVEWAEKTAWQ